MIGASVMWEYIQEQPDVINTILDVELENLETPKDIVITASGSSLNSAMLADYLQRDCSIPIRVIDPFDLRYYGTHYLTQDTLLIGLSQTGRSVGVIDCLTLAKELGVRTLALSADDASPVHDIADDHVNILCGDEPVGPKTKGFIAMTLMLHRVLLAFQNKKIDANAYRKAATLIPETLANTRAWCEEHDDWKDVDSLSIIGYGVGNAVAREGALKVLETLRIPIMNYNLEEFMHGPHRTITPKSKLIYLHQSGPGQTLMTNLIKFTNEISKDCLVISSLSDLDAFYVASDDEALWVNQVVVFQVICTYFPESLGVDPAAPVYGAFAKTVGTRI